MTKQEQFMQRCLDLAILGLGNVAPNPLVGAVLVYEDAIIGEGYHQKYGAAHAEVNCLQSVSLENRDKIAESTLYVNLEPCNHFGKTPPCCDLILRSGIKKVVIANIDPNPLVAGAGISKLRDAGVEVNLGVLEEKASELNKRFFCFQEKKRPYILLKYALSINGFFCPADRTNQWLSDPQSKKLVHKWRAEEAAVLVGFQTVLSDNPQLTVRLWEGEQPLRIVLDRNAALTTDLAIFNKEADTLVINMIKNEKQENIEYAVPAKWEMREILDLLYEKNIQSVMVEGGEKTLLFHIDANYWDEARIIHTNTMIKDGIYQPIIHGNLISNEVSGTDRIITLKNSAP